MKLMPQGDYYLWYCEWCDSRNRTLWTRVAKNELCCTVCHKKFSAFEELSLPSTRKDRDPSYLLFS